MHRFSSDVIPLLFPLLCLAAGCKEQGLPESWPSLDDSCMSPDAAGELPSATDNLSPIIYNLEINSWKTDGDGLLIQPDDYIPPTTGQWHFCVHLDWRDDNANLYGGFFSMEIQNYEADSVFLGTNARMTQPPPYTTEGEFEIYGTFDGFQLGEELNMVMRAYDRCGAESRTLAVDANGSLTDLDDAKRAVYYLGTEHMQEDPLVADGAPPGPAGTGCTDPNSAEGYPFVYDPENPP